ncbi:glycosyl hydrolase, partial [Dactylonectria estremocensis]
MMRYIIPIILSIAVLVMAETFSNPVIWEDLADNEVHRVGDTFYMSASTMHYSPGAPILRSYDLVNWEYIGHSVPTLDFSSKYNLLDGQRGYIRGIWASSLRHRESDNLWYFVACVDFSKTYVYTSSDPAGTWSRKATIDQCYYDVGLLFDDDDIPYVAFGNTKIRVAQLSADAFSEIKQEVVFETPEEIGSLEGARMYKRRGNYYIFLTRPPNAQYILKSSSPWGPYEIKVLVDNIPLTSVPNSGAPHQGSLVETQQGSWYYMGFTDIYPGGRSPVLAPITWGDDGFPTLVTVDGEWGDYDYPLPRFDVPLVIGTDQFSGTSLKPQWEWNHNPDINGYTVYDGLTLRAVTVTNDLYQARNTLTHRIHGPTGIGTILLDFSDMADGDRTGFAVLRDKSAYIGIERNGDEFSLVLVTGVDLNTDWTTNSTGTVVERKSDIASRQLYLRVMADIQPGAAGNAIFAYSSDGEVFETIGPAFGLHNSWEFFMGYRYAIFNFATKALGGSVHVRSFTN